MQSLFAPVEMPQSTLRGTPRDYQVIDHDESFRLWDSGVVGTLTRLATGTGKTITACLKANTWMQRGHDYHFMVISYEQQLVGQFAKEIEFFLGIVPGIEMADSSIDHLNVPKVVVASRQTLLVADPPDAEQLEELAKLGVTDVKACHKRRCKSYLTHLRKGADKQVILDDIREFNDRPEIANGLYSRLHKFDWRLNWLICCDEAHRFAHHLRSVKPIIDWFEQNPKSRRFGLSATPKRSDNVSIGHKMFPGVSIDYPLFHASKPNAVADGYCVPYIQKYIHVESVDFSTIKKVAGDYDEAELEKKLGDEKVLASLIEPMLDLVGDRQTLIFSPGVDMAKNVAAYINARCEAKCPDCDKRKWYANKIVGDGAKCECGHLIETPDLTKFGENAKALWGEIDRKQREPIYDAYEDGKFQFMSICALCQEGFNSPITSAVAIFRPVSREASARAEQMKGRGCRPLRGTIDGLNTREERLAAIAKSAKQNALIIDLVGCTGLADCASTVQIYAEGLPDEVVKKAEEILNKKAEDGEADVAECIEQAKVEVEQERERIRLEREEAERRFLEEAETRAKAGAEVKYTEHDVGHGSNVDTNVVTDKQLSYIRQLGMDILAPITKKQAGRIITQLKSGVDTLEVARTNRMSIEEHWRPSGPSLKQVGMLNYLGVKHDHIRTPGQASALIEAKKNPKDYLVRQLMQINQASGDEQLTQVGREVKIVRGVLPPEMWEQLARAGQNKRASFHGDSWEG